MCNRVGGLQSGIRIVYVYQFCSLASVQLFGAGINLERFFYVSVCVCVFLTCHLCYDHYTMYIIDLVFQGC